MNLQNSYVSNYSINPAFKVSREPLRIESEKLKKFNLVIGLSREPISNKAIKESKELLGDIFQQLLDQKLDKYEREFIKGLHTEILNYLDSEFIFRAKLKKPKFDDPNSKALRDSAFFYSELSESTRSKILKLSDSQVKIFRERAQAGLLKRTDLSINEGKVVVKISKLIDKDFRSQGIFDLVSDYVGIKYTFTGVSLELSVAGSTWWKNSIQGSTPPRTMYAHLDESIYAPKAIVYLSDVGPNNGPTSSYPGVYDSLNNNPLQDIIGRVVGRVGNNSESILFDYYAKSYHQSMGSIKFREHFMMLPESLRFNSHFGWDILADSELEGVISDREEVMLGGPGKFVVFDGSRLLHRGGLIEEGERLVLQVVFWPRIPITKRAAQISKAIIRKFRLRNN
jgi:hypothetical protein